MKNIIFDLDLTLIDSTVAELARRQRDWSLVYSLISQFVIYEGIEQVFDVIRAHEVQMCIVSTSPFAGLNGT